MDPSATYGVPTRALEAEIEIDGGRREEVMSDYFNRDDADFAPLLMGESVVYVNKEFTNLVYL